MMLKKILVVSVVPALLGVAWFAFSPAASSKEKAAIGHK